MSKYPILAAALIACIVSVLNVAFAAEESIPTKPDTIKPASATPTEGEREWIKSICEILHPMSTENYTQCVAEREKSKKEEKAKAEETKGKQGQ